MKKNWLKLFLILTFLIATAYVIGFYSNSFFNSNNNPVATKETPAPTPYTVYSFESLKQEKNYKGNFKLGNKIKDEDKFSSYDFSFNFKPNPSLNETKNTSGLINIPKETPAPLIIMFRGYVDPQNYVSGTGTKNAAEFFAGNGFITVAPDFLGYADSDTNTENIFESRFQTYTTAMSLLSSVDQISDWDGKNVFIWGHSNGGQISITALEITGVNYPTVLWAPVTKPFPYSILYYTDESEDRGKLIRSELSKFEKLYDVEKFSLTNYLDWIQAPISLSQGTADTSVPPAWSDNFVTKMESLDKDIKYNKYPGADHNLRPSWDNVVSENLEFYKSHLKN